MLEVLACPLPASIQDGGRPGYRHLGVPLAGALDPEWLALANALVGNRLDAAAIEMRLLGPRLGSDEDTLFAIAGDADAKVSGPGGTRAVSPWRSHRLVPGEILQVGVIRSGVAYLAFAGGIAGTKALGSRSRYERANLGTAFVAGSRLPLGNSSGLAPRRLERLLTRQPSRVRILAGPQRERFTDTAWQALTGEAFSVGREADRMGLRLDGPRLDHVAGADIVSDGVTPGAIQVPGDGRPIILLADCQTVGGYAKIATVIGADLPRLGHALPGQRLEFEAVSLDEAIVARSDAHQRLTDCLASIAPDVVEVDLAALYGANLIDGVIDAGIAD